MLQEIIVLGILIFSFIFFIGFMLKMYFVFTTDNKKLSEEDIKFKNKFTKYKRGK